MRTMIVMALVLLAVNVKAQTIVDGGGGLTYAEIEPVKLTYLKGEPTLKRLYVKVAAYDLIGTANLQWWIRYPIDTGARSEYATVLEGTMLMPVMDKQVKLEDMPVLIYQYIAAYSELKIEFK